MKKTPTLCITPGCPNGIGPEVLAKALLNLPPKDNANFLFAGAPNLLKTAAQRTACVFENHRFTKDGKTSPPISCLFEDHELPPLPQLGDLTEDALKIQATAIQKAVGLAKTKEIDGLVTGPVRKEALKYLGEKYLGHTEYLHAHLASDANPPLMAFGGGPFLLGLATIHIPIKQVSSHLSVVGLRASIHRLASLSQKIYQKENISLVALGLNPHAGEHGLLGDEEEKIIKPALHSLREEGVRIEGPLSADGFFARFGKKGFEPQVDGVLAMYHDQGLAPYKILARGEGVNITSGLSIVRTSPDHGTADDIAGQNKADAKAMKAAIETCLKLVLL